MKVTSRGFEITEVCQGVGALRFDGDVLRLDESSLAHSVGYSADDVLKLIEALTEAHRLMTATTPIVSATPVSPAPHLKDRGGDIWTLEDDGETYSLTGFRSHWSRECVERQYGPVTELRD